MHDNNENGATEMPDNDVQHDSKQKEIDVASLHTLLQWVIQNPRDMLTRKEHF